MSADTSLGVAPLTKHDERRARRLAARPIGELTDYDLLRRLLAGAIASIDELRAAC
jgi:hypothetical protein